MYMRVPNTTTHRIVQCLSMWSLWLSIKKRGIQLTNLSPAAQLEAKANREHLKLLKVQDELQIIWSVIKRSDLPGHMKMRLYAAMKTENELLEQQQNRLAGMRQAAEISRGKQWVTYSDE